MGTYGFENKHSRMTLDVSIVASFIFFNEHFNRKFSENKLEEDLILQQNKCTTAPYWWTQSEKNDAVMSGWAAIVLVEKCSCQQ